MSEKAEMMLSLADAIEDGNPNDNDGMLVLDAEQCSLIAQSLRDKVANMQADHFEKPVIHVDQDGLLKHVEAALDAGRDSALERLPRIGPSE